MAKAGAGAREASGSGRSERKAAGAPSGGKAPPYKSSLSQFNNSWYKGEDGEGNVGLRTGSIAPVKAHKTPATDRQDKYTRGRNVAADKERYNISDCTNAARRDYSLRYASPDISAKDPQTFEFLPRLKFVDQIHDNKKAMKERGSAGCAGAVHAVALEAGRGRLMGIQDPKRFATGPA